MAPYHALKAGSAKHPALISAAPTPKSNILPPSFPILTSVGIGAMDSNIVPVSAPEFFLATLHLRWIHLPKAKARESWTNLSRSVLNSLILPCPSNRFRPPVVSASFVQPGQRKATRLINLQSLLSYVQGRAAATAGAAAAASAAAAKKRSTKKRKKGGKRA
jgi:hypothetical protein